MIRDSAQYGSFDGLDNRKNLMQLFVRLGSHLSEREACRCRAEFLQSLISDSTTFDTDYMRVTPCTPVNAYHLCVAICGSLGVDINVAARKLEEAVKNQ